MQLHPTRSAVDLNVAGIVILALGVGLGQAVLVAWGGSLLLGLQIARAVTLYSVSRIRAAGFEMLWSTAERTTRASVGHPIKLTAEVRNRDDRAARYVQLRALHSPFLEVTLEPNHGEVPAGGRLKVEVIVCAKRVGHHGIFGLSLEVQGSPGLYEVPLTFSNPFGVEALPTAYERTARPARGGRSRLHTEDGLPGKRPGGNHQLREIREYSHGDPFKRIAWKATARRGKLMTREYDLEEKAIVWVVLDASVELWSGPEGHSPLDSAIDQAATLVEQHLSHGDRVGLVIVGHRRLCWLRPNTGPQHGAAMMEALAFNTQTHDADRSGLSEAEVSSRVLEHLRPLDSRLAEGVRAREPDRVSRRAAAIMARAPFNLPPPAAEGERERTLRQYLRNFGIAPRPRLEPDRPRTDRQLLSALKEILSEKPRASTITLISPAPGPQSAELLHGLRGLPTRRAELRWLCINLESGLGDSETENENASAINQAIRWRAQASQREGERQLRRVRVRLQHPHVLRRLPVAEQSGPQIRG